MAETQFVLSQERFHAFLQEELGEWKMARQGLSPLTVSTDRDLLEEMSRQFVQLFMKHTAFASDDFLIKPHRYPNGTETKLVDQFAGAGHIKLSSMPLRDEGPAAFKMSIAYQSFFVDSGRHISPSPPLKKSYALLVRTAKRRTRNSPISPNRKMWVGTDLLGSDPDIIERVRSSFCRPEVTLYPSRT